MARRVLISASAIAVAVCTACGLFDFERPRLVEASGGAAGQQARGGMPSRGGSFSSGSGGQPGGARAQGGEVAFAAGGSVGQGGGDSTAGGAMTALGGEGGNVFAAGEGGATGGADRGSAGSSGGVSAGGLSAQGGVLGGSQGGSAGSSGGVAAGGLSAQGGALGGTSSAGGLGGSSGEGCSSSRPFPSAESVVRDDFASTGQLDARWSNLDASSVQKYTVADGQLSSSAGLENALFWSEKQGPNQEAYAKILSFDPLLYGTVLLLKANRRDVEKFVIAIYYGEDFNGGNYIGIHVQNNGWKLVRWRNDLRLLPGQTLGGRALANGCVQAFVDGEPVLTADISKEGVASADYAATATYVGLGNVIARENTEPTVWDNFGAGTIP